MSSGPDDNPYASPKTETLTMAWPWERLTVIVARVFFVLLLLGAGAQVASIALASGPLSPFSNFVTSRFGWIGLILGLKGADYLYAWLRDRQPRQLLIAGLALLFIAGFNAITLLVQGVGGDTGNPYLDRPPSAWGYSVASFAVMGAVVVWLWLQHPPAAQKDAES